MSVTNTATIDHTQVNTSDADFVVTLDLSEMTSRWWNTVKSNGGDIRVFTSGGTEVAREVVAIDTGSQTGILMWRSSGLSTSTDTSYDIEVDGSRSEPSPGASNGRESVWPTGSGVQWAGVYHLEEDPSGTAPQIKDSTSLDNDMTTQGGMQSNDLVSGKLGSGVDFNGSDQYARIGKDIVGNFPVSIQGWGKNDDITTQGVLAGAANSSDGGKRLYESQWKRDTDNNELRATIRDGEGDVAQAATTAGYTQDTWYQYHGVFDASDFRAYLDGANKGSASDSAVDYPNVNQTAIGVREREPANSNILHFDGTIDEVRFANSAFTDAWVATDYNNQSDPTTSGFFASIERAFVPRLSLMGVG